jgi:MinD-like ATPase involved in chromosome partitioning or flagellar assembly
MEGFFSEAQKIDSVAALSARKILTRFKPLVVVNRVRTVKDEKAGDVIKKLLKEYLSVEAAVIMTIRDDDAVSEAIAKLNPVMLDAPNAPFSEDIQRIASTLC